MALEKCAACVYLSVSVARRVMSDIRIFIGCLERSPLGGHYILYVLRHRACNATLVGRGRREEARFLSRPLAAPPFDIIVLDSRGLADAYQLYLYYYCFRTVEI